MKAGKFNGVRSKGFKANTLTRGLVFGPVRGDVGRIVSGKRLRVEDDRVGRAGGISSSGSEADLRTRMHLKSSESTAVSGELVSPKGATSMVLVPQVELVELQGLNGGK